MSGYKVSRRLPSKSVRLLSLRDPSPSPLAILVTTAIKSSKPHSSSYPSSFYCAFYVEKSGMCDGRVSKGYGTSPPLSEGRIMSCKKGSVVLFGGGVVARLDVHILSFI